MSGKYNEFDFWKTKPSVENQQYFTAFGVPFFKKQNKFFAPPR